MVAYCSVPQCRTYATEPGVSFHHYPKCKKMRETWLVKLKMGKDASAHSRVCSKHFRDEDFVYAAAAKMFGWKKRGLAPEAVPSLNLPVLPLDRPRRPERRPNRAETASTPHTAVLPMVVGRIVVMPPAEVRTHQESCSSQTTQATVSVTHTGTQCALRFVSSAGSQTETALTDLEVSSHQCGASLHPTSLDGVVSSGPARDHVDEQPGDCSSFTSREGKMTGNSTMTQMRGNLGAGQSCQQSSCEKTLLVVDLQQVQSVMRPYSCNVCKGTFLRLADVLTHMKVHSNEDRYTCSVCQESFGTHQGLVKHKQWHTNGEPYACSICQKVFTDRRGVVRHERVHTNEKPHVCSVCGKSFVRRSCLVRHERTHTGERPYVCSVCEKGFTEKCKLVLHQKMHTREMPHVCSTCHMGFPYKFHLVSHQRSHTGTKDGEPGFS